ncbi:MAG: SET domain-containing protein, partial [bacterium]|nr:SET domain-containing protein [bacterium]
RNSTIEGQGVFALRNFKKGEIVLQWDISHTLSEEKVKKISSEGKKYISFLKGKYIIMQEPEKYVNHSCEPNTTAKYFCDVAVRDIMKDEEITADYAEELPPRTYMECRCGSRKCRKIIRA